MMSALDKAWSLLKNEENPQATPTEQMTCPHCEGSGVIHIPYYANARRQKLIEDNPEVPESYFNHIMMSTATDNSTTPYKGGNFEQR